MTNHLVMLPVAAVFPLVFVWQIWRVFRPANGPDRDSLIFFPLIFVALFLYRLPVIAWNHELNMDESQMLAQGMRFLSHPVPWADVDGTTSGPLNSMALTIPMLFGAPASWATARTVLWLLHCATLFLLYLTLRCFGPPARARLALMPAFFFYVVLVAPNFTLYSSETLPVLLLSAGLYLLARQWRAALPAFCAWICLGLFCGAIPFAKLQAAPLAAFLVIAAVALTTARRFQQKESWRNWWRNCAGLGTGLIVVPGLILGAVILRGAFGDFWKSYILSGVSYAKEPANTRIATLRYLFHLADDFRPFVYCAIAAATFLVIAWFARRSKPDRQLFWPFVLVVAFGMLTFGVVVAPGKPFAHYTLLFVPAFAIFIGLSCFAACKMLGESNVEAPGLKPSGLQKRWLMGFIIFVAGLQLYRLPHSLRFVQSDLLWDPKFAKMSYPAEATRTIIQPGDTLSVWGWMPSYYVETGLTPATRDAIGHYMISDGPLREYYRRRYLADLEKNPPAVFIDAVAETCFLFPGWTLNDVHESSTGLSTFIDENYTLWLSVYLSDKGKPAATPVRIYLRKERINALRLPSNQIVDRPAS